MAIVKSENKIKFIKAKLAAYNDINVTYPHCIFFATDDKSIMVDNVKYGEINVLNKIYTNKLAKKKVIITVDIDFDKFVSLEKLDKKEIYVKK